MTEKESAPARMGQSWSEKDVEVLLLRVKEKKSTKDIAIELERSVGAVKAHKLKLAIDACTNKGIEVESAIETYGVSKTQLESALEKKSGEKKLVKSVSDKKESGSYSEMIDLLKEIHITLKTVLEKMCED
jgi:DNA-binding CsgD family transcriptional regulator